LRSLKEHLTSHGFKIIKTLGCPQPISIHKSIPRVTVKIAGYFYNFLDWMFGRFPSLSNSFAIFARK